MVLITHHNCPQFILRNGLITGAVPGHWGPRGKIPNPQNAQRACQGQITHSDISILMIACARAHFRLMYTACKQRRKHFPLHGTDKGFLTTEEINVPDEDSNTAASEIAPSDQFSISTLTLINMPSWWLSKWWKTVFTIKATDTDWEAIYGPLATFIVFHVSGFTSTLYSDEIKKAIIQNTNIKSISIHVNRWEYLFQDRFYYLASL